MLLEPYSVIVFDAFGTLFDVHSVSVKAEKLFPGRGNELSLLWRQKQVEYSWLRAMSRQYKPFWTVTSDALDYSLKRLNLRLEGAVDELMQAYETLSPFEETSAVIDELRNQGYRLGILTNGNNEMISTVLKNAGLSSSFEQVLTSDKVQTFKTVDAIYELVGSAFAIDRSKVLFVSSNAWDAAAATWFGFDAFWINRLNLPFESLDVEPRFEGESLTDLLRF
jgi:2-haloacid dehalogenase